MDSKSITSDLIEEAIEFLELHNDNNYHAGSKLCNDTNKKEVIAYLLSLAELGDRPEFGELKFAETMLELEKRFS